MSSARRGVEVASPFALPRGRDYVLPGDPVLDFHLVPEQSQMLHGHLNIRSRIIEPHLDHPIRVPVAPAAFLMTTSNPARRAAKNTAPSSPISQVSGNGFGQ